MSNIIFGLECGGSDTTSGLVSNPVLGCVVDLIIKAGGSAILLETPEMIGAGHILANRYKNELIAEKIF
ncbi:MAG: hypothetical protein ACOWWO_14490 [Peptococcaceae bacterium]